MTPLTTPIFDFHNVISALTTPLTIPTPTPSLVKTSLEKITHVTVGELFQIRIHLLSNVDVYNDVFTIPVMWQKANHLNWQQVTWVVAKNTNS